MLSLMLIIFAFVLCLIHSFMATPRPVPAPWLPHLGWLALALFFLSLILGDLHTVGRF